MANLYRVTAPVAVVDTGTLAERYIYRDGVFEADPGAAFVAHLLDLGFITEVEQAAEVAPPADASQDDDLASLTVQELRRLAAEQGLTVPKSATKAALVDALEQARLAEPEDLSSLDVADLLAQAAARGIDVPDGVTDRDDLIALLNQ